MSHVPSPGDFNEPGDQNDPEKIKAIAEGAPAEELPTAKRKLTPEELAAALARVEPDGSAGPDPFKKGPILERPRNSDEPASPQPAEPNEADRAQMSTFAPIKELGREHTSTFHIVVPDARPHVTVPLTGPGAYEISVKRRQ